MSVYDIFASQNNLYSSDLDLDDPRRPLLGTISDVAPSRCRRVVSKLCSAESWRRRLPITIWLPKYTLEFLLRDAVAGITVGLTSIPQGIAYALVAGLPPQVGLYSSIFPGYIYVLLGSCKDVTVGPTAILAALLAKYVAVSPDFAYLASFLSGCVILLLGILQLGFLLDFISRPVISAFTTAAALQIGASQLKGLFRISGASGGTFVSAMINFFKNIKTIQLWDSVLGVTCIVILFILKKCGGAGVAGGAVGGAAGGARRAAVRARNALVVFGAALLAYILHVYNITPFALTGHIEGGLPHFGLPPFSTVTANNQTLSFTQMLGVFGGEGLVLPLVAVLESIAIAKAFSGGRRVDATQELLALGACNVAAACCGAMPATGSFTRTALNHASGVATPAGAAFKATLVLLTVTLLAPAFYFIPRCALAAVILAAMASLLDFALLPALWKSNKVEAAVWVVVAAAGAGWALELGVVCGALADVARAAAAAARPRLSSAYLKIGNKDCLIVTLTGFLLYSCAEYLPRNIRKRVHGRTCVVVLDAATLSSIDVGVAENLITVILDLEKLGHKILLWNFSEKHQKLFEDLHPGILPRFVCGPSIDQHILNLAEEQFIQRI